MVFSTWSVHSTDVSLLGPRTTMEGFNVVDIFRLSHVYFTSDFDRSMELGVFMVSVVAALQPTIGLRP